VVCAIRGEIDMATGPLLRDTLVAIGGDHAAFVIADMTEVTFLSATGARTVTETAEWLHTRCRGFALVIGHADIRSAFERAGLIQRITTYPCLPVAIDAAAVATPPQWDGLDPGTGAAADEWPGTPVWRLRRYMHEVAAGLGVGPESVWCEMAEESAAYVAMAERCVEYPNRDLALLWDGRHGWAAGVETNAGEDILILAWYGPDVLPPPGEVVGFARAVLTGQPVGQPVPPEIPPEMLHTRLECR
jgi:anti-anti-sigma factor